jgi:hypothetical protein
MDTNQIPSIACGTKTVKLRRTRSCVSVRRGIGPELGGKLGGSNQVLLAG